MAAEINTMPYNRDAEGAFGSLLIDNDIAAELVEKLTEDDFYQESHKFIIRAMQTVFNDRKPIDLVTLSDQLDGEGNLEKSAAPPISPSWRRSPPRRRITSPITKS